MASAQCNWISAKRTEECPYVGGGQWDGLDLKEVEAICLQHHIDSRGKDPNLFGEAKLRRHTCYEFDIWEKDNFVGDFITIRCTHNNLEENYKQAASAYRQVIHIGD